MSELQRGRAYLTEKGLDLLAYAQTGGELHFTRASIGDGEVKTVAQILEMEKLVNETKEVTFNGVKHTGDGTATISLSIDNEKVENGFLMREVGLFARDPRYGEILYGVISYLDNPDFISPELQELTEILLDIVVVVSNVSNITLNIDRSNVWATQLELLDLAGIGRTTQTVKGNWDLIQDLNLKVLMLIARLASGGGGTGGIPGTDDPSLFKISFPLSESEEWGGIYDAENGRLIA